VTENHCDTAPHCEGECYWHDDVTGCLNEDEYVNSIETVIDYDPSTCRDNSEVEIFTRTYVYGNIGSTGIELTDLGFEEEYEEINSYADSSSTLTNGGGTINFEQFNEAANSNKNLRTQSRETGTETTEETRKTHSVEASLKWKKKFVIGSVGVGVKYGFEHQGTDTQVDSIRTSSENTIEGSTSKTESITENVENFWEEDVSGTTSNSIQETKTYTMQCKVESLSLEPLAMEVVSFSYNRGVLRCQVKTKLLIRTSKGHEIDADFESKIQSVSYSTCDFTRRASFITESFDCNVVLTAGISLGSPDAYSAQCIYPQHLYNPLQRSASGKWCSTLKGDMIEHTYEEFVLADRKSLTVRSGGSVVYVFDDDTHLDCTYVLADEDICLYHDVIDSDNARVGLLEYHIAELAETDGYSEMLGYMKMLKFVIPPRIEKLVHLEANDFKILGYIRDGDGCPGHALDKQEPSDIFTLTNESFEDKIFWVVVNTDTTKSNKYFLVEVLSRPLDILGEAESDVCNKDILWREQDEYEFGCGFYA